VRGSIVGAGVFVGIGVAVGNAGPAVIPATALASTRALCNAQLAAKAPKPSSSRLPFVPND
jgi:L-asparagine transporter-like permease